MEAATVPLVGDRWTPFVHTLELQGDVLTGAAIEMHVRLAFDAPGSPLIDIEVGNGITIAYAGSATVAAHLAAGRISEVPEGLLEADSLDLSLVDLLIPEVSMEAMPFPAERGDNAVFHYDIHVTPSGGTKQVWFRGTFTVRAGAVQ